MTYEEFLPYFDTVMTDNNLSHLMDDERSRKFYDLMTEMLTVNKTMNLTAIKEEKAVILRHFADSLCVAAFLPENARIIDVGCGAGFPSLPLAISRPDLKILALDSTEKRVRYVESTAKLLKLPNLTAIAARAEELAHTKHRESFDVATARAVAALPVLSELCLPFVRVGGRFIAMKAKKGEEELSAATKSIGELGGEVFATHNIRLVGNGEVDERLIIEVKKARHTPAALPRAYAKIVKKPL